MLHMVLSVSSPVEESSQEFFLVHKSSSMKFVWRGLLELFQLFCQVDNFGCFPLFLNFGTSYGALFFTISCGSGFPRLRSGLLGCVAFFPSRTILLTFNIPSFMVWSWYLFFVRRRYSVHTTEFLPRASIEEHGLYWEQFLRLASSSLYPLNASWQLWCGYALVSARPVACLVPPGLLVVVGFGLFTSWSLGSREIFPIGLYVMGALTTE